MLAALVHPDAHLVTLTVTEKGYLDRGPTSAAGLIARALEQRYRHGLAGLTVLSCDNRAHNGAVAREAVLAAADTAGLAGDAVAWIEREAAFPSSMVDRITPATTLSMIDESSAALGFRDEATVWTEPFWQWVVEDCFAGARPDLASAGVQMVADVAPWEAAKLRLLNAAHSTLAYCGLLKGYRFVHEAIADFDLGGLIDRLWDEASLTIDEAVVDVPAYRAALRRRFGNAALPHALVQIAADGSQKLPPRLLATMDERAAQGLASPALARRRRAGCWRSVNWIASLIRCWPNFSRSRRRRRRPPFCSRRSRPISANPPRSIAPCQREPRRLEMRTRTPQAKPMLTPTSRAEGRLYERIASEVRHALATGRYAVGDRLPSERDLAQQYGVSRPTIREAIIALEVDGLVEVRTNSGVYVTALQPRGGKPHDTDVGPFELLEARRIFEAEICGLAAQLIDEAQIARLQELVADMESEDLLRAEAADREFHMEIARVTQNSAMEKTISMLWDMRENSPQYALLTEKVRAAGVAPRVSEHRRIVTALASGDPDSAREAMRDHLGRVIAHLLEATEVEAIQRARAEVDAKRRRFGGVS